MDMTGMLAISRAGHDKDIIYIIVKADGEYVYLADGKTKSAQNPKRKNRKHIQIIRKVSDESLRKKLLAGQHIYDEEIRKAIGGYVCQKQM